MVICSVRINKWWDSSAWHPAYIHILEEKVNCISQEDSSCKVAQTHDKLCPIWYMIKFVSVVIHSLRHTGQTHLLHQALQIFLPVLLLMWILIRCAGLDLHSHCRWLIMPQKSRNAFFCYSEFYNLYFLIRVVYITLISGKNWQNYNFTTWTTTVMCSADKPLNSLRHG